MNNEPLATSLQSNDKNIIDQLLKRIEQLDKENTELKKKLDFYENKGKRFVITEAIKKEIESYEEIILSQNTYSNNNILNSNCILEF